MYISARIRICVHAFSQAIEMSMIQRSYITIKTQLTVCYRHYQSQCVKYVNTMVQFDEHYVYYAYAHTLSHSTYCKYQYYRLEIFTI